MSSEKPFWEGKTGEELAGLHVKVTFETGAVAEGILNDDRCIHLGSYSFFRVFGSGHDGLVEPATPIKSIELVDDPECERIDDINAVRVGDVYVGTDGNRYPVVGLAEFADYPLRVKVSGGACLPHRDYFAYALRPKPKLPDHDGLWFDKYGALWMFCGGVGCVLCDEEGAWTTESSALSRLYTFTPFRPAKAVEA
jgi:hypothetical protein|nr:MAG TPA: hypothetical protein [Caudoviricetes sp.]